MELVHTDKEVLLTFEHIVAFFWTAVTTGEIMVWSSKALFLKMRDRAFVLCEESYAESFQYLGFYQEPEKHGYVS